MARTPQTHSGGEFEGLSHDTELPEHHQEDTDQKSPLLNLPGELRNRIYEHILEDIREHPVPFTRLPIGAFFSEYRPVYFGLTQTCQQLRFEFSKMYFTRLHYAMGLEEMEPFLRTFAHVGVDPAVGRIAKILEGGQLPIYAIDILPLLKVTAEPGKARFWFPQTRCAQDYNLGDLFLHISARFYKMKDARHVVKILFKRNKQYRASDRDKAGSVPKLMVILAAAPDVSQCRRRMRRARVQFTENTAQLRHFGIIVEFHCGEWMTSKHYEGPR